MSFWQEWETSINQMDSRGEVVLDTDFGVGTNVVHLDKRIKNPTLLKISGIIKAYTGNNQRGTACAVCCHDKSEGKSCI